MAYTTLTLGLTLTIPTNGSRNWGSTLLNTTWTKISQHNHTGSGDGAQNITASYSDYSVTTIKLSKNIGVAQASTLTPLGTTETINWNNGNVQYLDLSSATGDVTLTLSNPVAGARYLIWVTQGASFIDLNYPAAVKWAQAQKPLLSSGAGKVDKIELYYTGTEYRGDWNLDYA